MPIILLLSIALPFCAALIAPTCARLAPRAAGWILAVAPLGAFAALLWAQSTKDPTAPLQFHLPWVPSLGIEFSLRLDGLSQSFALLISGIGVLIIVYAGGYLRGDARMGRLFASLFLFMGAMLGVVLAGDLITLFVFWELTSIASYLLIGYDHQKPEARASALQALLVTGGGGLAMLAGFVLLGQVVGGYGMAEVLASGPALRESSLYPVILALILLGAFTKSAQFPFHFWLPNAMAAPTPVSAYLHSSTMVKAGVFLLARLHPALGGTEPWHITVTAVGAATAAFGGVMALRQGVMKPLLAYTTISALGLMVACLGIGTPAAIKAMMLFLFVHAFYKAAIFMTAGTLTHETGEKSAERLGGLFRTMPISMLCATLAALSMAGIPPLLGFVGKEVLYESVLAFWSEGTIQPLHALLIAAFVMANVGNVFAALLIGWRPFWGRPAATISEVHEAPMALWLGPALLGALGVGLGLYSAPLATALLAPGASEIFAAPVAVKLALWHGVNAALLLSGATLALGLAFYAGRGPMQRVLNFVGRVEVAGPEAGYRGSIAAMLWLANGQTRFLQNGYLRFYLLIAIGFVVMLPGSMLLLRSDVIQVIPGSPIEPFGLVMVLTIMAGSIATCIIQTRLAAVTCLGLVGCGISLVYVLYGAPDLAMTQFVIEILTLVIFLLVLHRLPSFSRLSSGGARFRDALVAAGAGAFMALLVYSAIYVEASPHVSEYFLQNSQPKAFGRDIVNTILVDFRALDTLGEITVLAVAALGAVALLRGGDGGKEAQ